MIKKHRNFEKWIGIVNKAVEFRTILVGFSQIDY